VKPVSYRRLSDLVAVGLLTKVFPPAMVDEVIEQAGRTEQRSRSLPARMMAYFAIGMGLYSEGSYEEVMSQVADGLSWVSGRQESLTPPSKSVSDSVLNKRNRRITLVVENRDHSATQTNLVIGVTSG